MGCFVEGALGEEAEGRLVVRDAFEDCVGVGFGLGELCGNEGVGEGDGADGLSKDAESVGDFEFGGGGGAVGEGGFFSGVGVDGGPDFVACAESVVLGDGEEG